MKPRGHGVKVTDTKASVLAHNTASAQVPRTYFYGCFHEEEKLVHPHPLGT